MFERFTDKARAAVILARAEAAGRGDQIRPAYMPHALQCRRTRVQGLERSRPAGRDAYL
jgi:hypothetical protein